MIEIKNVCKSFGNLKAVNELSLQVQNGQLFSFLGPNGAGKTTTIKMMTGLMTPDSGQILLDDISMTDDPIEAKRISGYIPDAPNLYEKMTGIEFLQLVGNLYKMDAELLPQKIDYFAERFDMQSWLNDRIEGFSRGMKQRVAFASAVIHDPRILIIDEPMVGLDPQTIRIIKLFLREKVNEGTTVFLSTHDLHTAQELSDVIAIINKGEIKGMGSLSELQAEHDGGSLEDLYFRILEN